MTCSCLLLNFVSKQKMKVRYLFLLLLVYYVSDTLSAQSDESVDRKYWVGSALFMVMNLVDDPEPPEYYQLNLGYRITPKDVLSLELITWKYYEPLGVPWAEKATAENFPGSVRCAGAGLAYKRFLWKQVYGQFHSTAFHKTYLDESGQKIQSGFQLFNTLRFGYQFRFFNDRVFLEPSIAMTFWPINTNTPSSFERLEDRYPSYYLWEPGLHFGITF